MKIQNENVSKNIMNKLNEGVEYQADIEQDKRRADKFLSDRNKNTENKPNEDNLKESISYGFTDETEFGSMSNTDALDTIEELARYFDDYAAEIGSNAGKYIDNANVMSEVSDILYQAKSKLLKAWENQ